MIIIIIVIIKIIFLYYFFFLRIFYIFLYFLNFNIFILDIGYIEIFDFILFMKNIFKKKDGLISNLCLLDVYGNKIEKKYFSFKIRL